jgi:hypothetical protein
VVSGSGEGFDPRSDGVIDAGSVVCGACRSQLVDQSLSSSSQPVVVSCFGDRPLLGSLEVGSVLSVEAFKQFGVRVGETVEPTD